MQNCTYCSFVSFVEEKSGRHYPNFLRVARQNAGYQQKQVASLLGHDHSTTLCDWENEKRMPSAINLIKLCVLYNSTPQDLYPEYCEQFLQNIESFI